MKEVYPNISEEEIAYWNKNPKPLKWTKNAERISDSILLSSIYTI